MNLYRIDICDSPPFGLAKRVYERGDENSLREKYTGLFPGKIIFINLVK